MSALSATVRKEVGSLSARRYRQDGNIPAILYGHGETPTPLCINNHEFAGLIRSGHVHGLLDLTIDGQTESAVIKEVQWDVFGQNILHVDFARVDRGEKIRAEVVLHVRGDAPGVLEGGVLSQTVHHIEVECTADKLPEEIVVNVKDLHKGQSIHVKELTLPEGVTTHADPDLVVVVVIAAAGDEPLPSEAEPGSAEPEVITKKKAEEED